jgi:exosortase
VTIKSRVVLPWNETDMVTHPNRESFRSSPLLIFAALGALAVAIWWTPIVSLFLLALSDEQYTHILLIFPVSAVLLFVQWQSRDWQHAEGFSGWSAGAGSAMLFIALLVTAGLRWKGLSAVDAPLSLNPLSLNILALNILALVAWWMGAFVLCFGIGGFRRALFPVCFLLWMVPLPPFLLDPIVNLLQRGSAASAHLLFAATGFPVEQRNMLLHIPGLTLEVAPECSSIRSSMMLLVTTMVVAQLLLVSFWRKAAVVAAAIPLSIAKNGLRIFVIGALTTKVDPGFMTGRLHRQGGVIFLMVALLGIFLILWALRRGENGKATIFPKTATG